MKSRIQLTDTTFDMIFKMSGGNPGAVTVLAAILKEGDAIDPDAAMAGFMTILTMDTFQVYDEKIWVLYKYVCNQELGNFMGLIRATQLGFISVAELQGFIKDEKITIGRRNELLAKVRETLPGFKG